MNWVFLYSGLVSAFEIITATADDVERRNASEIKKNRVHLNGEFKYLLLIIKIMCSQNNVARFKTLILCGYYGFLCNTPSSSIYYNNKKP